MVEQAKYEEFYYKYIFGGKKNRFPRWRGNRILKYPSDLVLYEQVIFENQPDLIIETGTAYGGSAIFLADMLELMGKPDSKVITIDKDPKATPEHPRIEYVLGRTTSTDVIQYLNERIDKNKKCMVILDSDHRRFHVKRELHFYSRFVTPGQYLVVEDCWYKAQKRGPAEALEWFLKTRRGKEYELIGLDKQFITAITRGGWLRRK